MKSLTEQWKNGELESGLYYCKTDFDEAEILVFEKTFSEYFWRVGQIEGEPPNVEEVLEPVPSYSAWAHAKYCEETIDMIS